MYTYLYIVFKQVKKQQLITLQLMPSSPPPPTAPPISYDQLMRGDEMTGGTPMSHLMPPSYDDLQGGGGAVGGVNRYSQNFDDDLILQDADWYQAGLPRYHRTQQKPVCMGVYSEMEKKRFDLYLQV